MLKQLITSNGWRTATVGSLAVIFVLLAVIAYTHLKLNFANEKNVLLTASVSELTLQRDQYKADYVNLKDGLAQQAAALAIVRQSMLQVEQQMGAMSKQIGKDFKSMVTTLTNMTTVDMSSLSCEQAIDVLRQSAIRNNK